MSRLLGVVNDGTYTPKEGAKHFFGENCLLLEEARGVLRGEVSYDEQFRPACEKLRGHADTFCQVYGVADDDRGAWEQGKHLLLGLSQAVLAACSPGSEIDYELAEEAVGEFNAAWPWPSEDQFQASGEVSDAFRRYCKATGAVQKAGFWVVWDILDGLVPEYTYPAGQYRPAVKTASLPILLFGERGTSQVATLTVDLIFDGGRGFRPDPLGLGLTALSLKDTENFLQAMLRAWKTSGLEQLCRARWKITTFRPPDQEPHEAVPFAAPCLTGRSAEAAACCALWAAWGGVPGEPQEAGLKLDPWATVTAELGEGHGKQSRLDPVGGIPGKLKAARDAGIQMVLVSTLQDEADFKDHWEDRGDHDDPVPVNTVGEAFEKLLAYWRMLDGHHRTARVAWIDMWEPGTAEVDLEAIDKPETGVAEADRQDVEQT